MIEPEGVENILRHFFRVVAYLCGMAMIIALTIDVWRLVTR